MRGVPAWLWTATTPRVVVPSVLHERATATSPASERPPQTIEELRARSGALLERERVPGVGIALVDASGVNWAGGVGVADLASGTPVA